MQKKLIALAVAGLSSVAFAQSNVTVYGVADVAVGDGPGAAKFAAHANDFLTNGNSRLGFKGSEDLGGGLKANFNFEQGINLANGATEAMTWGRQAWVGLSGGFGQLQIGRNYTAGFTAAGYYELTGYANYTGLNIFGTATAFTGGTRNDAQVKYISPNFGGITVVVDHVLKANTTANAAETGIAVGYANGPLSAALSYSDNGNSNKDSAFGVKYDFGMGKLGVSYQDPEGVSKGWTLGVGGIKAGPLSFTVDYAENTGTDAKQFLVEAKYPLSKRTFVYGIVKNTKNVNPISYAAQTTAAPDGTAYSIGMRHNF